MTPAERKALAEELAREYMGEPPSTREYAGVTYPGELKRVRDLILRALDRATPASRIQAAERAVVEAAENLQAAERRHSAECVRWERHRTANDQDPSSYPSRERVNAVAMACSEAVDRLRALREQAAGEECGRTVSGSRIRLTSTFEAVGMAGSNDHGSVAINLRCHLPRGHEGEHVGELGV